MNKPHTDLPNNVVPIKKDTLLIIGDTVYGPGLKEGKKLARTELIRRQMDHIYWLLADMEDVLNEEDRDG
jgi:hypothetical protein